MYLYGCRAVIICDALSILKESVSRVGLVKVEPRCRVEASEANGHLSSSGLLKSHAGDSVVEFEAFRGRKNSWKVLAHVLREL